VRIVLVAAMLLFAVAGASALGSTRHKRASSRARVVCHKHGERRVCRRVKKSHKTKSHKAHKPATTGKSSTPTPWSNVPPSVSPGPSSTPEAPSAGAPSSPNPVESPSTPAAPARVEVTAEDTEAFRFVLSRPTVPAGRVILEFVNHGQDEHNLNATESDEALAGSVPAATPGSHVSLSLNLRPGSYTLFCSLAGHEARGMKATLQVQ
jgi:plastocyanin